MSDVGVNRVELVSGHSRLATIVIDELIDLDPASFYDLPEDMRAALREWVGADAIWRDGWLAHHQEWQKQKDDPNYPIGRDMPDWTRVP